MTNTPSRGLQAFAQQERRQAEDRANITRLASQNAKLTALASKQRATLTSQRGQITTLTAGLKAVAGLLGEDATAIIQQAMAKAAGLTKQADEQNPAQPVPEPAPEPATQSTIQAETPEAMADVQAPGMIQGINNDVAPDVTTTVFTPGADIPDRGITQLVDPTRPVEGTQGPVPTSQIRTETDVRAGNPMNPATAFPLDGPFAQQQRVGSLDGSAAPSPMEQAQTRLFAAQAMAKIQIQAGIADTDDEVALTQKIAQGPESIESLQHDTALLTQAHQVSQTQQRTASQRPVEVPRGVVPRSVPGVGRTMPPIASGVRNQVFERTASASDVPAGYASADDDLSAILAS